MAGSNINFIYHPLNAARREIRLLALDCVDSNGVFHYSLQNAALDDNPDYTALSYVWGAPSPAEDNDYHIFVNGQLFKLRRNLFTFLVRRPASNLQGSKMFIDAICINQMNTDELDSQIGLMRDVYRNAQKVIAWLGRWNGKEEPDRDDVIVSDYWSRLWIVQELFLAKNLVVQIGDITMSPSTLYDPKDRQLYRQAFEFSKIFHMLEDCGPYSQFGRIDVGSLLYFLGSDKDDWRQFRNASRAYIILTERAKLRTHLSRKHYPPLHQTISMFGSLISSKRRDKVFGLLGLSRTCVQADSKIPIVELYLQVLLEGLYEFAAIEQGKRAAKSSPERNREYDETVAAFQLACTRVLGLMSDAAVCLTTYRAMQHSGIIPIHSNLLFGLQRVLHNTCFQDASVQAILSKRPYLLKLQTAFYWMFSWFAAVANCLILQRHRRQTLAFGPSGEIRLTFEEWVAMADRVADRIDREAKHKRPISTRLLGPGSEWRKRKIRGIMGGDHVLDILRYSVAPAVVLWRSWQRLRRNFSWLRNVIATTRFVDL